MIPTLILLGLVAGCLRRPWYLLGLVLAVLGWPLLLAASDIIAGDDLGNLLGAAVLAAANTGVGIAVTRGLLAVLGTLASRSR